MPQRARARRSALRGVPLARRKDRSDIKPVEGWYLPFGSGKIRLARRPETDDPEVRDSSRSARERQDGSPVDDFLIPGERRPVPRWTALLDSEARPFGWRSCRRGHRECRSGRSRARRAYRARRRGLSVKEADGGGRGDRRWRLGVSTLEDDSSEEIRGSRPTTRCSRRGVGTRSRQDRLPGLLRGVDEDGGPHSRSKLALWGECDLPLREGLCHEKGVPHQHIVTLADSERSVA